MTSVRWFGDRAVVITAPDGQERQRLAQVLVAHSRGWGVRCGMKQVLVEVQEPRRDLHDAVIEVMNRHAVDHPDAAHGSSVREVLIEVRYSGEDLVGVAERLGIGSADLIAAHTQQLWRVGMMGFAPGFGYLEPFGPVLVDWSSVGRRDSPRERVTRGSVALAAGMSAVYPQDMPGGWQVIGSTGAVLVDLADEHRPTLLMSGDIVRFAAVPAGGR